MIELVESGVIFNEAEHTYTSKDGVELHGITKCVGAFVNPTKYDTIPEAVLAAAAERGHAIHSAIEIFNTYDIESNDLKEFGDYRRIAEEEQLSHIASEYIVTDNEFYASPIDWVCRTPDCGENEVCLVDFKSTSTLDTLRLAAQLTIYKIFFEAQNPSLKVRKIGGMWLPKEQYGDAKMVWVDAFDTAQIHLMLDAYRFGLDFEPIVSLVKSEPLPVPVARIEQHIGQCIAMQKTLDTYLKELKSTLLQGMSDSGIQAYKGEHLTITIKKGYVRQGGYDTDKLLDLIRTQLAPMTGADSEAVEAEIEKCRKADTAVADSLLMKFK